MKNILKLLSLIILTLLLSACGSEEVANHGTAAWQK
jgi:hypothetical protein